MEICLGHYLLPQEHQVLPVIHYCEDTVSAGTNTPCVRDRATLATGGEEQRSWQKSLL